MMGPDVMDEWVDKQRLAELVARLCRALDRGDYEAIAGCYTPDSYDDHGVYTGTGAGFADFAMGNLKGVVSNHHAITTQLFDVAGDEAWGESYYTMYKVRSDGSCMLSFGRYIDYFKRVDGRWLVHYRRVVPEWSGDIQATKIGDLRAAGYSQSVIGPSDPVYDKRTGPLIDRDGVPVQENE